MPTPIACFSVMPLGTGTIKSWSSRASSAYPPQNTSDVPQPVTTTSSPGLKFAEVDSSTTPAKSTPGTIGKGADHARFAGDREPVLVIEARIFHAHQHFARRQNAQRNLLNRSREFAVLVGREKSFEGRHLGYDTNVPTIHDVVVVGAGVFGAWTAYHLRRERRARAAARSTWRRKFAIASSGGESRIIRMSYGADEIYTRSSMRSLALWKGRLPEAVPHTGVLVDGVSRRILI